MAFFFAITNLGLENDLKAEMKLRFPLWRPAFQQKNLMSFKSDEVSPKFWPRPYLARMWGESFGPLQANEDWQHEVLKLNEKVTWKVKLHTPAPHWKDAWGESNIVLPEEAPSRAWLKIEEAIALFNLPIKSGQRALEFGAAPGGAVWSLLSRGLSVRGIDPALMDERCLKHGRFDHLCLPIQAVTAHQVRGFDWWLSDVNLAPEVVMDQLERLLVQAEARPQGILLTMKMTKLEKLKSVARDQERVGSWGYQTQVRLLPSHHREVLLLATLP